MWYHNWYRLCNRYCQNHWSELHILIKIIIYIHRLYCNLYRSHRLSFRNRSKGGRNYCFFIIIKGRRNDCFFLLSNIKGGETIKFTETLRILFKFQCSLYLHRYYRLPYYGRSYTMGGAILWADQLYYLLYATCTPHMRWQVVSVL